MKGFKIKGTKPVKYEGEDANVKFEDVTEIGDEAFWDSCNLKSVTMPDSVTEIDDSAFCGCKALASVDIPDGVTKIGEKAFDGCTCTVTYKGKTYASGKYGGLYKKKPR